MYKSKAAEQYANVMLPIAPFAETSGTYVNVEGKWQSFTAAVEPFGDAKPAWKIFRVIGNFFDLVGYDYNTSDEIRDEVKSVLGDVVPDNDMNWLCPTSIKLKNPGIVRVSEMQMYAGDSILRRAKSLHQTTDARQVACYINSKMAKRAGLSSGDQAIASQNGKQVILPVSIDEQVADDCVVIPSGLTQTSMMDNNLSEITLSRA
jgi:NADH-quinone oxidoreductase subunit G